MNSTTQGNSKSYSPNKLNCNHTHYEELNLKNKINPLEYEEKNNKEENTLIKFMEEIGDDDNINASTIKNQENTNSTFNNSIINLYDELKDKIPDKRMKNENKLLKEEFIEIYKNYKFYLNFIGNNYNICQKCEKNNHFYCEYCSRNLCDNCSKNCKEKHQDKLMKLKDEIEFYKNEIKKIIQEYFSESKKKEENTEKDIRSYQLIDINKTIDEPIKKLQYTNDIILIKGII